MYLTINKKRYYYQLQWQSFASLDMQQIKDALINESNPYYVSINFNNENGVLGYISSNANISNHYCIAASLINYSANDIGDCFAYIQKIPKNNTYYVLLFKGGQVENDDVLSKEDVVSFVRENNDLNLKYYISSDLVEEFSNNINTQELNIFDDSSIISDNKSKLQALSSTGNNIKLFLKIAVLVSGLYYLATNYEEMFFPKAQLPTGPSAAELAKIKNDKIKEQQIAYVNEQVFKRTGGISPVVAFKECLNSIKSMPVSIAGWKSGIYSCQRSGQYAQQLKASSMSVSRMSYSVYPNELIDIAKSKGLIAQVGFNESKKSFGGTVTKTINTLFEMRDKLHFDDLKTYKSIMDKIHFDLIRASDNKCLITWQKKSLGPLNPQNPLPPDLLVYFTDLEISCETIYLNKLIEQLSVFNRDDINFVFINLNDKSFKTRFELITKG